ncbi:MAG: A/G-specific adenine glycosylase [Planctomycetes bacterium]|nr:A/G-specific adenine glycosylase [Planctomycetota bacterium]
MRRNATSRSSANGFRAGCYGPDVPRPRTDAAPLDRARADAPSLRRALLAWFEREQRDLPWRRTKDPYAILVSELMLQQTRVDVVIPYFERFVERFRDVAALASAPEAAVLAAWSGLGYYRRARFLQAAARVVVRDHGGAFPATFDSILELPGVGRYTAGAIASIAFGSPRTLVDGNVARVFSRWFAQDGDQRSTAEQKRLWELAEVLLDRERPGDFNQALMELGACVCTPRAPRCTSCPVARWCEARKLGDPERYPAAKPRKATIDVRLAVLAVFDAKRRIGLVRRAPGTRMEGMLDLPGLELTSRDDAPVELADYARSAFRIDAPTLELAGRARHTITHHRIAIEVWTAKARRGASGERSASREPAPRGIAARPDSDRLTFWEPARLRAEGVANLTDKALRMVGIAPARHA